MATRWGVVSSGKICHDFVTAVQSIPGKEHEFVAIAARSLDSAQKFAESHCIPKAYGSYDELARDPNVEVVYIGNIASEHFNVGKKMLESGKHVLCEKPLTLNLKQTKELIKIAREQKRFLMEAVWSRFFPSYQFLIEKIKSGAIGDVVHVSVNFGKPLLGIERVMKKSMGGGTILDLGIYTVNAVTMVYDGERPLKIAAVGHLNEDGVDISTTTSLLYSKNRTASISTNAIAECPCELVVVGTKGQMKLLNPFWCPTVVSLPGGIQYTFELPGSGGSYCYDNSSGLLYEAMEVRKCLKRGDLESSILPLKDSELMTEIMDTIRHQIGMRFDED